MQELVDTSYLREVPVDPVTGSKATWVTAAPTNTSLSGVFDVHSGAAGKGVDGVAYAQY